MTTPAPSRGPAGCFITVEGIDGAGKSTHLQHIAQRWRDRGLAVVCTREPGGTPLAESLRALFLAEEMDALTEALLVFAARRDHLVRVIEPALASGAVVLCDRFTDATFAYQGGGRGFDWAVLAQLERWVQAERTPDLTLWFDVPPAVAAQRREQARTPDRLEGETLAFFTRVAAAYQRRAQEAPQRFTRIDGSGSLEAVAAEVQQALADRAW
ncbi:MAG: dTMP kinase [Burkholderiales bacterium]